MRRTHKLWLFDKMHKQVKFCYTADSSIKKIKHYFKTTCYQNPVKYKCINLYTETNSETCIHKAEVFFLGCKCKYGDETHLRVSTQQVLTIITLFKWLFFMTVTHLLHEQ